MYDVALQLYIKYCTLEYIIRLYYTLHCIVYVEYMLYPIINSINTHDSTVLYYVVCVFYRDKQ